jgi:hypothetical protein
MHYLWARTCFLLQDPTHAVIRSEAGDQVHIKIGDTLNDQLNDLLPALPERGLQGLVPHEWLGLAEQVAEGSHVVCLDKTIGHLIDKAKPASNLTNVGW